MQYQTAPPAGHLKIFLCFIASGICLLGGLKPLDERGYAQLVQANHGKVLLVSFWATWCEPCREELPRLAELARRLKHGGLDVVTISTDEPEQAAEAESELRQAGLLAHSYTKSPMHDDNSWIGSVDPGWSGALPALFVYDRSHRLKRKFIGESDWRLVEAQVLKLLDAGTPGHRRVPVPRR